ncbi:MAG TPA: RHS repeat-associated core domain-containing protein [Thermoguttaceae bacterium]|nr:RHS repeat-associated core domain-containing protein [Thermoguttaceae bacterium]
MPLYGDTYGGGGGTGGSVYLTVEELWGSGLIAANGGAGGALGEAAPGGGGGGGRVAVYYVADSGFSGQIEAGGTPGREPGGAGTIFLAGPNAAPFVSVDTAPTGLLRTPVDHVDLVFTRHMDPDTITSGTVHLWGPDGEIPIAGIVLVHEFAGRETYRVSFPLRETNGAYRLSIGPNITGVNGRRLDQDYDGAGGEPVDDVFEGRFTLDTVGPRITRHVPAGDVAGTVDSVDVWFSEAIQAPTFTLADVRITGPDGTITPTSLTAAGSNCFRIAFDPQTTPGEYHVLVGPAVEDLAGNPMDQDRDGTQGDPDHDVYDASFNLVDVDLALVNVSVGAPELWAGEPVDVSWDGHNDSGMPLLGDWTDAVYLSADNQWDIDDALLATAPHTGGLAQDETYHESVSVLVPGVLPGDYHIIVRADLYNQEKEGGDEGNNIVAIGPIALDVRPLTADGTPVGGTLTETDRRDYYAVQTQAGDNLALVLDGLVPGASAKVFAGYEEVPTRLDYEYRSAANSQGYQELVVGGTLAGTYYVLVYGEQVAGTTSYNVMADAPELAVVGITPDHHGVGSACTMTLTGGGFDDTTAVEFVGTDASIRMPTATHILSPTTMTVLIDTPTWPQDTYDVVITKPAVAMQELTDAFEVTGGVPYLETRVIVPSTMGYHWAATIWIEYANTGGSSMAAPLLRLHGTDEAILTLDESLAGRGLWTDTPPAGTSDTVQVMATGSGATAGILQPGDSGRIPVYYLGQKQPWDFSDRTVEFSLGVLTADSTEPIDWPGVIDEIRPESLPADAWNAICANLADQVGATWGDYVAMLNENMNYLHTVGQNVSDVASLLAFEIDQASGLSPYDYLAGEVDVYSSAPGISLTFGRIYGQPIDSRYELGALGRGWDHNWNIRAEELSDGDVVVHGPSGTDRYFSLIGTDLLRRVPGGGGYEASPGDYGTLTQTSGKFRLTEKHGTVWQFRSDGLLEYVEDTSGNRITCGYTSGRLTSLTHSSGALLLLDYGAAGRVWHVTDPRGSLPDQVTTFEYDPTGEYLLSVTAPGGRTTTYTYETAGTPQQRHALLSVAYPDGTHEYFTYDARGRLIETHADAGAESVTYAYDAAGTVTVEDATGRETVLSFGLGGQLVLAQDGEGNTVGLAYDDDYQLTGLTGGSGERYRYSYDARGNLVDIEDPLRRHTVFTYTSTLSDLASVTDARGNGIAYGYDADGNPLSITYEDGTSESFTYDAAGNVLSWTNRRGETVAYTYSAAGQLTSKDYPDTPGLVDFEYTYDDAGNLTSATGPEGTTAMSYDPDADWLTRIDYPGGRWFEFEYDAYGRRTQRTDQDGNIVDYIYDAVGRLDWMTDGTDTLIVDYDYDDASWLARKTLGNGVYTSYEYDDAGQLLHLVTHAPDDTILSRLDYTYDPSGRRTSMTTLDGTYAYGYDPLSQLTSVSYPDGHVVAYVYDAVGNRIKVTDDGAATAYTTNEMNQYTDVGAATYTFDADGNMLTKTEGGVTTTYTYDIENRLVRVETPTDTWEYAYDAFGNRVASTYNGVATNYVVDLIGFGDVAAEYDAAGDLVARYDHGFGLVSRSDAAGDAAWYTFDAIGSTSELTGPGGAVLNTYAYDPFGISLGSSETVPNAFQYVGEYGVMHETNGLEFMRARFYQPAAGRFVSPDPIGIAGGEQNLYGYVGNCALIFVDPKGLGFIGEWRKYHEGIGEMLEGHFESGLEKAMEGRQGIAETAPEFVKQLGDLWVDLMKGPAGWVDAWDKFLDLLEEMFEEGGLWYSPQHIPNAPADETDAQTGGVAHMVDPNDKVAPAGYGEAGFIPAGDLLAYTIRFENVSDATAPAHIITITDTLDDDLDLSTFELTEIAFAGRTIIVPKGLDHYETTLDLHIDNEYVTNGQLRVEIEVSLDLGTRELTCTLAGLDPETGWLPEDILLGILYPNDDTGRGDGHVSYTVKPQAGLPTGTEITNKASIVFDWNDPIDTPLVLNTLDAGTPTSAVESPAGTAHTFDFPVTWAGEDEAGGSGVGGYDVYVSEDGSPYEVWLSNTAETSSRFPGEDGHTYSFYSIATDNVGHVEEVPVSPDTLVTVDVPKWTGNTDEHWENALNWSVGLVPGATCSVIFNAPASHQPALHQDESVVGLYFYTPDWAINGQPHTLTVGEGGIESAGVGANTIDPSVTLSADSTWAIDGGSTLDLNGALDIGGYRLVREGAGPLVVGALTIDEDAGQVPQGAVDLKDTNLIVDYPDGGPSPFADIAGWIASGYNADGGGYWDGPGITSSTAAAGTITAVGVIDNADPETKIGWSAGWTSFDGVPIDETSVLVKYTYYGDLNFDGIVDSNDYDLIDNTFALYDPDDPINTAPAGGWRWSVGDVTYDGVVDSNDYDKIDNAFALQSGALGGIGGPVAVAVSATPAPAPPETALLADRHLTNEDTSHARNHEAISALLVPQFSLSAEVGNLASSSKFGDGLRAEEEVWAVAAPAPAVREPMEPSVELALAPDAGVPDLLALSALDVRL